MSINLPVRFYHKSLSASNIMESDDEIFSWEGRILVTMNLPYDATPQELRDFFAPRGKILRVDIERTKHGESNGLGYVEFLSANDCQAASELNGTQFNGRTMKCKISTRPPPELLRFYIRDPNNRPLNDRIRQNIIEEARNGKVEKDKSERKIRRPRYFPKFHKKDGNEKESKKKDRGDDDDGSSSSGSSYSYSYSESGYSYSESDS